MTEPTIGQESNGIPEVNSLDKPKPDLRSEDRGASGLFVALCCGLTAICTLAVGWIFVRDKLPEQSAPSLMVATVDVNRLLEAQTRYLIAKGKSPEEMSAEGIEFGKRIRSELTKYGQVGITVLADQVVLSSPPGKDLTADLAKRLGVVIDRPTLAQPGTSNGYEGRGQ